MRFRDGLLTRSGDFFEAGGARMAGFPAGEAVFSRYP